MLPVKLFILIENDFPRSRSQQKIVFIEVMGKHKVSQGGGWLFGDYCQGGGINPDSAN